MGSTLMALAVSKGDDEETMRTVVLLVAIGHLVIKNTKHCWMGYYTHGVAHCSAVMMASTASTSGDMTLLCAGICYGVAFLLKGDGSVQDALRIHKDLGPDELSYLMLAAACWLLAECMVGRYTEASGLY
jgi:hypothetical protein